MCSGIFFFLLHICLCKSPVKIFFPLEKLFSLLYYWAMEVLYISRRLLFSRINILQIYSTSLWLACFLKMFSGGYKFSISVEPISFVCCALCTKRSLPPSKLHVFPFFLEILLLDFIFGSMIYFKFVSE